MLQFQMGLLNEVGVNVHLTALYVCELLIKLSAAEILLACNFVAKRKKTLLSFIELSLDALDRFEPKIFPSLDATLFSFYFKKC